MPCGEHSRDRAVRRGIDCHGPRALFPERRDGISGAGQPARRSADRSAERNPSQEASTCLICRRLGGAPRRRARARAAGSRPELGPPHRRPADAIGELVLRHAEQLAAERARVPAHDDRLRGERRALGQCGGDLMGVRAQLLGHVAPIPPTGHPRRRAGYRSSTPGDVGGDVRYRNGRVLTSRPPESAQRIRSVGG